MCLDSRTACKHKLKISQSHLLHSTNQADPRPPLPYKSEFAEVWKSGLPSHAGRLASTLDSACLFNCKNQILPKALTFLIV